MKRTEAGGLASLDCEPISTLAEPLPLPPYNFDPSLSEDENMLTWVSILARHSFSKKGHMGAIFVAPPTSGDPSASPTSPSSSAASILTSPSSSSSSCLTSTSEPAAWECMPPIEKRIRSYANNTPLLYARIDEKKRASVPEIHAEALAVSRSARRGTSLEGSTVYVSFPPCNECFKLLLSVGIRRCVYKKSVLPTEQGDAILVAAEMAGIEMVGTLDAMMQARLLESDAGALESGRKLKRTNKRPPSNEVQRLRDLERREDEQRDARVRAFWAAHGEDATKTRARVERSWQHWHQRYHEAKHSVDERWGRLRSKEEQGGINEEGKAEKDVVRGEREELFTDRQTERGLDITQESVMDELAIAQERMPATAAAKRPYKERQTAGALERKVQKSQG